MARDSPGVGPRQGRSGDNGDQRDAARCSVRSRSGGAAGRSGLQVMVGGQLPGHWWAATRKCIGRSDWQLHWQIHRYNPDLYILRQTACSHAEKPFLYLLFGKDRALLLDTGAEGGERALVRAVRAVLARWLARNRHASIPLVVGHLHSHSDHIAGDEALSRLANTTVIPHSSVRALQETFGIRNWPTDLGRYDLGGRVLDVEDIPGHDETSSAIYDRQTGLLLTATPCTRAASTSTWPTTPSSPQASTGSSTSPKAASSATCSAPTSSSAAPMSIIRSGAPSRQTKRACS